MNYYKIAIQEIQVRVKNPKFFVFTDDADWVKDEFSKILKKYQLVDWNLGSDSWQDMALMSNCKHNIIANSSFSWWGAWLNKNDKKIVIAPEKWFSSADEYYNTKDIIPSNWIKI